jgi:site-specific recombinase XerD
MIKLYEAHTKFIDHLGNEGKSESTLVAYSKDIEQLIEFLSKGGVNLITEVELEHLENFMKKLANDEYTPKSISRKTNATKTFFKFLHLGEHIKANTAEYLKHPKIVTKEPRILSKLEYRALRDAARDDIRTYAMLEVLLQTGVTISELSEIKLEQIKFDNSTGELFVPKKNNKEERTIPLNKAVVDAIRIYIEKERPDIKDAVHLFITKTGNPILVRNIRSTINRYFNIAGVVSAKVNDLRHTFVAHHLSMGVSLLHLSKISGHKRVSTTERYLQYIEREVEQEKTELGVL